MALTYSRCVDCLGDGKLWVAPEYHCADGAVRCRRHRRGHELVIDVERARLDAERHARRRASRSAGRGRAQEAA